MSRRVTILLILLAALFAVACSPTDAEVGETPAATLPPAPATATLPAEATAPPTAAASATVLAATPTLAATATPPLPGQSDAFIAQLQAALAARDSAALQALMADPFTIGYWLSEGVSLSPAEAASQILALLPEGATLAWAAADADLTPLLQGMPPASFLGPDKQVAAAVLGVGWGDDGAGEAIQFITQLPDGSYRWDTMLYSSFGFGTLTQVEAVVITADEATFYSGPGTQYAPVATVVGGMNYPVIGANEDSTWWRLRCYDDANAQIPLCWVSADPAVSSPTTP